VQEVDAQVYEVIVSDDGVLNTAEELVRRQYPWVKWVEGRRRGPAANRNNGAKSATGEWLVFLDDDCLPEVGWLAAIYSEAKAGQVDVIEGKTMRADQTDGALKYGIENAYGGGFFSCNLAIRRQVFFDIGSFDEDFLEAGGEDMEFAWRIQNRGITFKYVNEAMVLHPVRVFTLKTLWWRTLLARWLLLYRHKTGQAVPITDSDLKAVAITAVEFFCNLLRRIWHLFSRGPDKFFRGRVFEVFWNLVTFPILLPYLMIWELRFRKQLRERESGIPSGHDQ